MIVMKILNNNSVVCLDDKNQEFVVRGKGIAYKTKVNEKLDESSIEKIYRLDNKYNSRFIELLQNIKPAYLDISDDIINYAKLYLGKKLNDIIYISLTDHIAMTIDRYKNGLYLSNSLLFDIKRFYPDEYHIGLYALNLIKEKENVTLKEDEAGFIAIHIVSAQIDEENSTVYEITNMIQEILKVVRLRFNIIYNEESVSYFRFVTHLKYFAQRIISKNATNDGMDLALLTIIKTRYASSYECVNYIEKLIYKNYSYTLSDNEKIYLTIHIEKVVSESKKGCDFIE